MTALAFLLWLLLGPSGIPYNPFAAGPSTWTRPCVHGGAPAAAQAQGRCPAPNQGTVRR